MIDTQYPKNSIEDHYTYPINDLISITDDIIPSNTEIYVELDNYNDDMPQNFDLDIIDTCSFGVDYV